LTVQAWLKKKDIWDNPNDRSSHKEPTLRGGGLASLILMVSVIVFWVCPENTKFGCAWLAGLVILTWVSLRDDRHEASIVVRLAAQVVAVWLVLWTLPESNFSWWELSIVGLVMVSYVNFVNFVDGINGLVTGLMVLIPLGMVLVVTGIHWMPQIIALALAGSAAGFLPFNFPRAKMFLGDVGSITLGFSSGVLILWVWTGMSSGSSQLLLLLFPLYFFLEGLAAVLRRIMAREEWWKPHRKHFYQRLVRCGWSHSRTTAIILCIQCLITLLIWKAVGGGWSTAYLWALCMLVWGVFFAYVEILFRVASKNGNIES
jgi:UDP-N-acetylmuramyl pentapeptide phosphotransferase/UDP-N-acetylglucosamine-1-phosphate transferase